ncbi:protein GVQW3-like [Stegodyphus dumicola]|uniref:protein GVQW3-like n=1 Tax=Stegodyphus dumicola TaxID=202533 RepID=UPI0015AFE35B|nr:protein GVQW3-like [Stegodyphus dumicola]
MGQDLEQRYAIKFCVRLNKTATETLGMIQEDFKEEGMSRAMVFLWHKRFKGGCGNVEDNECSGRPSSSRTDQNVERVRKLLNNDRRLSDRLIADELALSQSTVWRIVMENLMMRKVCAKLVPKVLSMEQKKRRRQFARKCSNGNLIETPEKVVTGDETWSMSTS